MAFFLALRTLDNADGRFRWGDVYPQKDGSVRFLLPSGKSVRRIRLVAVSARQGVFNALLSWLPCWSPYF